MKLIMRNEPNLGQSQIVYNPNLNNGLQRKIDIGHLVKTNPNEPKFTRHSVWRAKPIYKKDPAEKQGRWFFHPLVEIRRVSL
jgi:hypothetical protein